MALTKINGYYFTEFRDEFGERKRERTGIKVGVENDAAHVLAQRLHNDRKIKNGAGKIVHRESGSPSKRLTMTLNAATDKFFDECEDLESADDGLRLRAGAVQEGLNRLCLGIGKSKRLDEITTPDVIAYRNVRKKHQTRYKRPIAPATVNKDVELLRRVLRHAGFAWGVVLGVPIEWGKCLLKVNNKRKRFLSREEEKRLFDNLRWDFAPMVRCALMTGMRAANVWGLKWEHVDLDNNQLHVVQKGRRDFSQAMSPALRQHILAEKGNHPEFVFTYIAKHSRRARRAGERQPFTKTGWSKPWRAALSDAKIPNFKFHDNRHTAATRVATKSGSLPVVMEFLGHADIQSTMRYAHLIDGAVRKAATDMHDDYYPTTKPKKVASK